MNKALNKIADISVLICPLLFSLKIIMCALGRSHIDWFDALFIFVYTFIMRDAK